jgi:hypothetical protein
MAKKPLNPKSNPSFSKITRLQITFLLILSSVILMNLNPLIMELKKTHGNRQLVPYNVVGFKFLGLNQFLADEEFVGYYTDQNMDDKDPQKMFAHAQYILAPTVVDFGNLNHRYIVFACSNQEVALRKIEEIGAQPLISNQYNIILAKRKDL